jgi:sialic acid synthase SpsE
MHCVSCYPTPDGSQNLRVISTLSRMFDVPVGLSDHAADISGVAVAVTLGASMYERHFMLPGTEGVDAAVSSTPEQLAQVVAIARQTHRALGHGRRECLPAEAGNMAASRRSLHARRTLNPGDIVTPQDIVTLRPSAGLAPGLFDDLVGAVVNRVIDAGTPFLGSDLPEARSHRDVA